MYILQAMIIGYCAVLAGFLLSRPRQLPHQLLATFLLAVGAIIAINHSVEAGWLTAKPLVRELLPLLLGPLFYGFVKALVYRHWQLQWRHCSHLLPLLLWLFLRPWLAPDWRQPCLLGVTFVLFSSYLVLALRLTWHRQQQICAQVCVSQSTELRWIQRTIAGFLLMVLLEVTELLLNQWGLLVSPLLYLADMLLLALLFAGLVWEALRQPAFLQTLPIAEHLTADPLTPLSLEPEDSDPVPEPQQLAALDQFIRQSQIYQQPNLTVQQLAAAIALPPRQISQLINQGFSRNFSDFMNGYRVRAAAVQLLTKTPPDNMLTLLHQVGFNSKSTFNLMFKREFGCTPSQYRNLHHELIEK